MELNPIMPPFLEAAISAANEELGAGRMGYGTREVGDLIAAAV